MPLLLRCRPSTRFEVQGVQGVQIEPIEPIEPFEPFEPNYLESNTKSGDEVFRVGAGIEEVERALERPTGQSDEEAALAFPFRAEPMERACPLRHHARPQPLGRPDAELRPVVEKPILPVAGNDVLALGVRFEEAPGEVCLHPD